MLQMTKFYIDPRTEYRSQQKENSSVLSQRCAARVVLGEPLKPQACGTSLYLQEAETGHAPKPCTLIPRCWSGDAGLGEPVVWRASAFSFSSAAWWWSLFGPRCCSEAGVGSGSREPTAELCPRGTAVGADQAAFAAGFTCWEAAAALLWRRRCLSWAALLKLGGIFIPHIDFKTNQSCCCLATALEWWALTMLQLKS